MTGLLLRFKLSSLRDWLHYLFCKSQWNLLRDLLGMYQAFPFSFPQKLSPPLVAPEKWPRFKALFALRRNWKTPQRNHNASRADGGVLKRNAGLFII